MLGLGVTSCPRKLPSKHLLSYVSIGASAAYSASRKLNGGYQGNAIRVRRSSDNAEIDIGFNSAGNLDQTALLNHVGADSGFVTVIYDQSGNARNLTQATAAKQPRIVNGGVIDTLNGKPVVRTDGVSQSMATAGFVIPQPFTRASVLQFLSVTSGYVLDNATGGIGPLFFNGAGNLASFAGSVGQFKAGISVNDKATVVETYNGASSIGSYNGVPVVMNPGTSGMNGVKLGSNSGVDSGNYSFSLYGDILIFAAAITTADRVAIETNQKAFYGTP